MIEKNVALQIDGITISGRLYVPVAKIPGPAVCICHGIPAEKQVPGDSGYPLLAERICREGFTVLIFNFRGTGASGGNLDIAGWVTDLRGVIDYLYALPEVDKSHLSLLGFSGGAAVSVCVAARDSRVLGVAACACPAEFDSVMVNDDPESIVAHFRGIGAIRDADFPPSAKEWLDGLRRINPVEYVAGIAPRPLLLVHGSRDEAVAVSHARELYDKAGEPKQLHIVAGAGHRLRQNDEAVNIVINWLKSQYQGS